MKAILTVLAFVMFVSVEAKAINVINITDSSFIIEYTEPNTHAEDGAPLDDLESIRVYTDVLLDGILPEFTVIPASSPAGGLFISHRVPINTNAIEGSSVVVWATAVDFDKHESVKSPKVTYITEFVPDPRTPSPPQ